MAEVEHTSIQDERRVDKLVDVFISFPFHLPLGRNMALEKWPTIFDSLETLPASEKLQMKSRQKVMDVIS
jgi:hypothetical protein